LSEEEQESSGNDTTPEPESKSESKTESEQEIGSKLELDRSVLEPASTPLEEPAAEDEAVGTESMAQAATSEPVAAAAEAVASTPVEKAPVPWALYFRLAGFVSMLVLAIVGMYFIREEKNYVWIYWMAVVVIYMVVSFIRGYQNGKLKGETLGSALGRHFMHWGGLIIVLGIMMVLEDYDKIDTDVAANILLLLLALTCYLAGVHFDRLFIVIGVFLAVIALLATLESSAVIWGVSILLALLALGVGFLHFRSEANKDKVV